VSKRDDFLRTIADPAQTAVLTMELQEGVVGKSSLLPALADEVERTGVLDAVRRVCGAARTAGARVVHCTAVSRPDGAGATQNCTILGRYERLRRDHGVGPTEMGTPGADLVAGLDDPRDIVVPRLHGMSPFMATSLDQILRNLGVRTVVATGVSVNIGVFGLALNAVDLGYQVVVVRDAVAGVPAEYAQAIMDNSLSMLGSLVTADELLSTWDAASQAFNS
jgi:nicotinamidase-related amidase